MEGVLLIRFSISKLNELPGPYEFQKGLLIGKAVPAEMLNGMTIFTGDTLKTLCGREYLTLVAIKGDRKTLRKEIKPRIVRNGSILSTKAGLTVKVVDAIKDPLLRVGTVKRGVINENGWCSKGLLCAWDQPGKRKTDYEELNSNYYKQEASL